MSTRVSRGTNWIKRTVLSESDRVVVGVDVHKKTYHVAIWCNGQIVTTFQAPPEVAPLAVTLEQLHPALESVVYEAGPTGYSLARKLLKRGFPVAVIAPSKTPRVPGRETKSDRLDCRALATYEAQGLLRHIAVPTDQEEQDRQLVRFRDQLVAKRRRIKQQIKSFLLMHGIPEPEGLQRWTVASISALRRVRLATSLSFCLNRYLDELAYVNSQTKTINRGLWDLSKQPRHAAAIAILCSHPGVGRIVSVAFRMEIFDPQRFRRPTEVSKYLGLSPRVYQSGQTRRDGSISKTGRQQLRATLIEATWIWIRRDAQAHATYRRLVGNTGSGRKAIVAMARRLGVRLWKMLCTGELYRPAA